MLIYPSINKLMEKTQNRYTLVVETAKRARQVASGAEPMVYCDSGKTVTIAINEIYQDKLTVTPLAPAPEDAAQ